MKPQKQCAKCPWRVDTDPHDIPDGYCETKHRGLTTTIAKPDVIDLAVLRIMACHRSKTGKEIPCAGWLANQLGPGNNIGLRLAYISGDINGNVKLVGPQHETFEDTLP